MWDSQSHSQALDHDCIAKAMNSWMGAGERLGDSINLRQESIGHWQLERGGMAVEARGEGGRGGGKGERKGKEKRKEGKVDSLGGLCCAPIGSTVRMQLAGMEGTEPPPIALN